MQNASVRFPSVEVVTNSTYPSVGKCKNQRHDWAAASAKIDSRYSAGFMTIKKELSFFPPVEEILAFWRERNIGLSVKC